MFLSSFSINLLASIHECRCLIGYATHYLFCFSINFLAFYQECRSLIGYATRYLFCFSINLLAFYQECRSLIGYDTRYILCKDDLNDLDKFLNDYWPRQLSRGRNVAHNLIY